VGPIAHGVIAALTIGGVLGDTGLVHAPALPVSQQLLLQAACQMIFAATVIVARMTRRTQLRAIDDLEREVRRSAHSQALLLEARAQLARVARPDQGRFSGQQIGDYLLDAVIGRGAMGEVYAARGPAGAVAIKLLSHDAFGNPDLVQRFLRELKTAAAVVGPNVVRVLEIGHEPIPYLVMERLEGNTLSDILLDKPLLSDAELVDLVRQVGVGITAAGAAGIVHRDLKPQNVFRHGDTWKILDFGIARAVAHGNTLTAGQVVGTPSYMAPEQVYGGALDHATDLYGLAAIAYRALTGHPPFALGELAETLYRVVHTPPRPPSELAPHLPPEVDLVFAIALAKPPNQRFHTAAELVNALAEALAGRTLTASIHKHS
jgi:serine/threonine-protein kinase